jgi:hypothetical protein
LKRWLALPLVQIALALGIYALIVWRLGRGAAVLTSPLLAYAVARPVWGLLAHIRHFMRASVWLPVHGRHYVFKGTTLRVVEDDDHGRWVCLADVRKVVGITATEGALAVTYPGRIQPMGEPAQAYLRDDALIEHLGKETHPAALRLRNWVERTIAFPGRRVRKNFGIHDQAPAAQAGEDK